MREILFPFFILITFSPSFGQHASTSGPWPKVNQMLNNPPVAMPGSLVDSFQPDSLFPANPFVQINNRYTGTFISEDGLVLTTNKVLSDENLKGNLNKETLLPGTYARRQLYVKNVTADILEEMETGFSPEKKAMYIRRNTRKLIKEEEDKNEGVQVDIKAVLGGREYYLYAWETFPDLRLVSSSEEKGWAILRIYKEEQAFQPRHFLNWAEETTEDSWAALYGYPKETFLNTLPLQKITFFGHLIPFQIRIRNSMLEVWEANRSDKAGLERQWERLQLEKVRLEELAFQDLNLYVQPRFEADHNGILGSLKAEHPYRETLREQKQLLRDWTETMQAGILLQEVLRKNLQLFNLFRQLEFLELPPMNPASKQQKEVQTYLDNFYASFDRGLEKALFEKAMELYFTELPVTFQSQKVGQKYAEAKKDFQEMGRIAFASSLFFKPELTQAKLDQGRDAFLEMLKRDYLYEIFKEVYQSERTISRKTLPEIESQITAFQDYFYDALSSTQQNVLPEANGSLRYSLGKLSPETMTIDHQAIEGMEGAVIVNKKGEIVGVFVDGEQALLDIEEWFYEENLVKWPYKKK